MKTVLNAFCFMVIFSSVFFVSICLGQEGSHGRPQMQMSEEEHKKLLQLCPKLIGDNKILKFYDTMIINFFASNGMSISKKELVDHNFFEIQHSPDGNYCVVDIGLEVKGISVGTKIVYESKVNGRISYVQMGETVKEKPRKGSM